MNKVAQVILSQLGNQKFVAMVGAFHLLDHGNGLSFKFKGKSINYCKVTLTSDDLYFVEFGRCRGLNYGVVSQHDGVDCEQLEELFTRQTGLLTRLY